MDVRASAEGWGVFHEAGRRGTSTRRRGMRVVDMAAAALGCAALLVVGCERPAGPIRVDPPDAGRPSTRIEAGEGAARRIQAAFINARPGDVIELGAGRFDCRATLSL